jgi:hypothetical protein
MAGSGVMSHRRLIVLPTLALTLLAIRPSTGLNIRAAIVAAVRAPYVALEHRDARALCSAFTPAASRRLAPSISRHVGCQARVAKAFAASAPFEPSSREDLLGAINVSGVSWRGDHAKATLSYGDSKKRGAIPLALEMVNGSWRVSTPPTLGLIKACFVREHLSERCPKEARVLLFLISSPMIGGTIKSNLVPIPANVKLAGDQELRRFDAGMSVAVQSGCLACHRIGDQGNRGPGPGLTRVGSALSARQIEHAILDPTAPMPSFSRLSKEKLDVLVYFLSQLR